jgi:hypothetical protein
MMGCWVEDFPAELVANISGWIWSPRIALVSFLLTPSHDQEGSEKRERFSTAARVSSAYDWWDFSLARHAPMHAEQDRVQVGENNSLTRGFTGVRILYGEKSSHKVLVGGA